MAKWDLSKLPEGRKPLPDEWFRERAQMQERIKELEAKLAEIEPSMVPDPTGRLLLEVRYANYVADVATKKAKELEAKLAKAVADLQEIDRAIMETVNDLDIIKVSFFFNQMRNIRTIITELKGEKPTS